MISLSTPSSRLLRTGSCVPRKAYGRFEFLICDLSLMKSLAGEKVVSQVFVMADNSEWSLEIFLGGKTERQAGFVTTEVVLLELGDDDEESTIATINLAIISQKGHHVHDPLDDSISYKSLPATVFRMDDGAQQIWAVDNFCQMSDMMEKFVHNNSVLFALDIEILGKPISLTTSMPAFVGTVATLSQDLETVMSDNDTFSDIVLVVQGKKFNCHKCILASRSSVFKKKFLTPAFKAKLLFNRGEYHLNNIDVKIFECILRFIYTDEYRYKIRFASSLLQCLEEPFDKI